MVTGFDRYVAKRTEDPKFAKSYRKAKKMVLERDIERAFVARLKRLGISHLKLNGWGRRGYPDRMILVSGGRPLFIELKKLGGKLTALQEKIHWELLDLGYAVKVFDDVDKAVHYVIQFQAHEARNAAR